MTTSQSTTDRARDAAGTAQEEGRHVAGVAQEEAQRVASEAAQQARSVLGDAVTQVSQQAGEQGRAQRDRVVGLLQSFGDDLGKMSAEAQSDSIATQAAREVAGRAQDLAQRLDGREPAELLDEVRDFARRRPGTFLLGALVAGVVAGRVLRGAKDSPATSTSQGPEFGTPPGASGVPTSDPPRPAATHGQPTTEPVATEPLTTRPDDVAPMGTPAAGYGERGTLGGDPL